jgi:hypothetical protein
MRYANTIEILKRLLSATLEKKIVWTETDDEQGWFTATVGNEAYNTISFRYLYLEAWPQIGADRSMIDFHMPGLNDRFACGTEGFDLLYAIYVARSGGDPTAIDATKAVDFLERNGL